jgi:hypothetical protein
MRLCVHASLLKGGKSFRPGGLTLEQGNEMNLDHEVSKYYTSSLLCWLWSGERNSLVALILIDKSQAWSKGRVSIEIHIKCTSWKPTLEEVSLSLRRIILRAFRVARSVLEYTIMHQFASGTLDVRWSTYAGPCRSRIRRISRCLEGSCTMYRWTSWGFDVKRLAGIIPWWTKQVRKGCRNGALAFTVRELSSETRWPC